LEVEAGHLAEASCLIADDEAAIPAKLNVHQATGLVPAKGSGFRQQNMVQMQMSQRSLTFACHLAGK
jgi:hypothetical protein